MKRPLDNKIDKVYFSERSVTIMKREATVIKKEQILEGISKLFFKKGYENTSIRDISKALGITNAGLYYYFKSKQEILFAIIDDLIERALVDLREKINSFPTPEEKISWIIESHIKFYAEHRAQTKVLVHDRGSLEGESARIILEKEREYVNFIRKVVGRILKDSKAEFDVNVTAFCLLGMLNWVIHWYNPEGRVGPEKLARDISRIFLRGLKG